MGSIVIVTMVVQIIALHLGPKAGMTLGLGVRYAALRIIGGSDSSQEEFPWQVSLQKRSSVGRSEPFCGGSIVGSRRHVLTAAHCLSNLNASDIVVVAGTLDIFNPDGTEQIVGVSSIRVHPNFTDYPKYGNDIAVLTLFPALRLTSKVKAIKLATADSELSGSCSSTGWGNIRTDGSPQYPDKLQKVTLQFMETSICADRLAEINPIVPGMICATDRNKGPCSGDSGGPLFFRNRNGEDILAGVVSWGQEPCTLNPYYPSVFSSVPYFEEWILQGV